MTCMPYLDYNDGLRKCPRTGSDEFDCGECNNVDELAIDFALEVPRA